MSAALRHFITCARNGSQRGSASGEQSCQRVAKAIASIRSDLAMIDAEAAEGACELMQGLAGPWDKARQQQAVLDVLNYALGK